MERQSRGRPAEFDREAAIRAAMELFWERGFEAVSASDLAAAMGIGRSSFYNSFGDRETVFREALHMYASLAPDAALARLQRGARVHPYLRNVFADICRQRTQDPKARGCLVVNSIGELAGAGHGLAGEITEAVRGGLAMYRRVLHQAVEQRELPSDTDVATAALGFVTFVSGLNLISKVERDETSLLRLCDEFLTRYGFGSDTD